MSGRLDLTGQRFGRLTVLEEAGIKEYDRRGHPGQKHKIQMWRCLCDCGNTVIVRQDMLKYGHTKSCGCLHRDALAERNRREKTVHGQHGTRLYKIYGSMKSRCTNPNLPHYGRYGGRGITICDEWLGEKGFEHFFDWAMEHGYREDLSIDRVDVDGPYAPWNCRWATRKVQQNNRRNNHFIEMHGECHTIKEWEEKLHVWRGTIRKYEKMGFAGDDLYRKLVERE